MHLKQLPLLAGTSAQVASTVRFDEGVVPSDVQFDPLSKQYMLCCCRNGSIVLYGISDDQRLSEVKAHQYADHTSTGKPFSLITDLQAQSDKKSEASAQALDQAWSAHSKHQ
jgi:hypothetical protein